MMRRHSPFVLPARLLLAFALLVPPWAAAAPVSCETFNPCTVGVCLEDGTCDATPANNGDPCDTFNPCTTGVCSSGDCVESNRNNGTACQTSDPCMEEDGECVAGECQAPALPNGTTCREDIMGPCVTGTCTTISTVTFCLPEFKCGQPDACDFKCNFVTGNCEPSPTRICDDYCTTGTCVPDEEFGYECTNIQNKPDQSSCADPDVCNGKCQAGDCVGTPGPGGGECGDGSVDGGEECDDGDATFEPGEYCDEQCDLVPCGQPTNSGSTPKASDALFVLKAAVQSVTCDLRVCDVNDSGSVTASDALLTLKKAVGNTVTLDCPTS